MNNKDEKKNIEHFGFSVPTWVYIVMVIALPILALIINILMKYTSGKTINLTSSTSPGFNLTGTPNM